MNDHARVLSLAAAEAVGEPDTIGRRPEALDVLDALSTDPSLLSAIESVAPGVLGTDPAAEIKRLAEDLATYRDRPLDDAPELIEKLLLVAWLVRQACESGEPTTERSLVTA
jgi:hypothetical protein